MKLTKEQKEYILKKELRFQYEKNNNPDSEYDRILVWFNSRETKPIYRYAWGSWTVLREYQNKNPLEMATEIANENYWDDIEENIFGKSFVKPIINVKG